MLEYFDPLKTIILNMAWYCMINTVVSAKLSYFSKSSKKKRLPIIVIISTRLCTCL